MSVASYEVFLVLLYVHVFIICVFVYYVVGIVVDLVCCFIFAVLVVLSVLLCLDVL